MMDLESKIWWGYLEVDLQELLKEAFLLIDVLNGLGADLPGGKEKFHDYSFVVFPAAKAYEGFLKKAFLDLGFITKEDYYGKQFRIGKSLNPSLPKKMMKDGVYLKIKEYCSGEDLAWKMWETWRDTRNLTFHWFPEERNAITFEEAEVKVKMIIETIDQTFQECQIPN